MEEKHLRQTPLLDFGAAAISDLVVGRGRYPFDAKTPASTAGVMRYRTGNVWR
jgi:hypothetical protein